MVGLLFMFVMPLFLVVIITMVQDTAFRKIDNTGFSLIIVDKDASEQSVELIRMLDSGGSFHTHLTDVWPEEELKTYLLKSDKQAALYIPDGFTSALNEKAQHLAATMLSEMGFMEKPAEKLENKMPALQFFYDPLLQDIYSYTITSAIATYIDVIENKIFLESLYDFLGVDNTGGNSFDELVQSAVEIKSQPASKANINPNSTQHNVPAWTIFAMFFIVVSLGNNIVKERLNGSFLRLKTIPVNFSLVIGSKVIVYVIVAIMQVVVIFSVGIFLFPLIGLPALVLPSAVLALFLVVFIIALAAVSYALMVGTLSRTQEQANGIGAVSIIIFAALGGILVPVFAMPELLKSISNFSPLYWCIEAFYFLFLRGGSWLDLMKVIWPVLLFACICLFITYLKLKKERIIS